MAMEAEKTAKKAAKKEKKRALEAEPKQTEDEECKAAKKARKKAEKAASEATADIAASSSEQLVRKVALVSAVEAKILTLIDERQKQPGFVPALELASRYRERHHEAIVAEELCQTLGLKSGTDFSDLLRGNYFPGIGVRGKAKSGGIIFYRALQVDSAAAIAYVESNILELLRRAAHPPAGSSTGARHSLDAGSLQNLYGAQMRQRFDFREFGASSMSAFIGKCGRLAIRMKGDKAHVVAKCSCCPGGVHVRRAKRPRDGEPAPTATKEGSDAAPKKGAKEQDDAWRARERKARKAVKAEKKAAKRLKFTVPKDDPDLVQKKHTPAP